MTQYTFKIKEKAFDVEILSIEEKKAKVTVNGEEFEVEVEQPLTTTKTPTLVRPPAVPSNDIAPSQARTAGVVDPKGKGTIKSPLPGKILDIMVKPGDRISIGQTIVCLEAMKMENNINSDREGIVSAVHVQKGDTVLEGNILVELT